MNLPMPDGPNKEMWLALVRYDDAALEGALRAGADPDHLDQQSLAPVMLAAFCKNWPALDILARYGASFPAPAKGSAFDAYFDVDPPWYEKWATYSAVDIATRAAEPAAAATILSLRGAGESLVADLPSMGSAEIAASVERGDRRFVEMSALAAARHALSDSNLSDREQQLLSSVAHGPLTQIIALGGTDQNVQLRSGAEHIVDRGFNQSGSPAVHALSFVVPRDDGSHAVPDDFVKEAIAKFEYTEGETSYGTGTWRVSDNVLVRLCSQLSWLGPPSYGTFNGDGNAYDADEPSRLTGTILFSESPAELNRYIQALGSAEATANLYVAIQASSRYGAMYEPPGEGESSAGATIDCAEMALKAIRSGADTSLSFFGWHAADVVTAYTGHPNVLRALIHQDPVTKSRLRRDSFKVLSPLSAALSGAQQASFRRHSSILVASRELLFEPAIGSESRANVMALLDAGAVANARVTERATPLVLAALTRSPDIIQALVATGCDVNEIETAGWTPLCAAIASGASESVDALLAAGADPNLCCPARGLPLVMASASENPGLVHRLFEAGASASVALKYIDAHSIISIGVGDDFVMMLRARQARESMMGVASRARMSRP